MNSFRKSERLVSKKLIDLLFSGGRSFYSSHFRITVILGTFNFLYPAQVLFSVSKKRLKHSTDRNFLKRKMRECYRSNKLELYNALKMKNKKMIMSVAYISDDYKNFHHMQNQMVKLIGAICTFILFQDN